MTDGQIIIEVGLDTSELDAKNLKESVENVKSYLSDLDISVGEIAKQIETSMVNAAKHIESAMTDAAKQIETAMTDAAKQGGAGIESSTKQSDAVTENAAKQVEAAKQIENAMTEAAKKIESAMVNSAERIEAAMGTSAKRGASEAGRSAKQIEATMGGAANQIEKSMGKAAKKSSKPANNFLNSDEVNAEVSKITAGIETARLQLENLGILLSNPELNSSEILEVNRSFERISKAILKASASLKKFSGADVEIDAGEEIESLNEKIKDLESTRVKLEKNLAEFDLNDDNLELDPDKAEAYESIAKELDRVNDELTEARSLISEINRSGGAVVVKGDETEQFQSMNSELDELSTKLNEYSASLKDYNMVKPKANNHVVFNALSKAIASAWRAVKVFGLGYAKILKGLGGGAARIGKASLKFLGFASGITAATRAFKRLSASEKLSNISAKGLLKTLISLKGLMVTRIKRMFISYIVENLKDCIEALALFDHAFDVAVSNIRNRMKELSANITVSLGGFVKQFSPMISMVVERLSTLATQINAFSAFLNGDKFVTVAKKRTDLFSESLDASAKSAEAAAKAQKELNVVLSTYDEIHKLDAPDEDSAADKAMESLDMYETVPVSYVLSRVPDYAKEIIDRMRQDFIEKDWQGLGNMFGGLVSTAFYFIDQEFPRIEIKLTEVSRGISEALNGFIGGLNAYTIGSTIGHFLNTILVTINEFFDNFDFEALGKKIGGILNYIVYSIDTSEIADALTNRFDSIIDTLYGLVFTLDFSALGERFAKLFNEIFDNDRLRQAGKVLGGIVKGTIDGVSAFFETVNWQGIGESLAGFFKNMFNQIDWSEVFTALTSGLLGIFTALGSFFKNVGLEEESAEFGEGLSAGLENLDTKSIMDSVSTVFQTLMRSAVNLLKTVDWGLLTTTIFSNLSAFMSNPDNWEVIGEAVGAAAVAIVKLLAGALAGAFVMVDDLEGAQGSLAEAILDGIIDGVTESIGGKKAKEVGEQLKEWLKSGISAAGDGFKAVWDLLLSVIFPFYGGKKLAETLIDKTYGTEDDYREGGHHRGNSAKEGLEESVKSGLTPNGAPLITPQNLMGTLESYHEAGNASGAAISNGLVAGLQTTPAVDALSSTANSMLSSFDTILAINSPSKEMENRGRYIVEGLANGLNENMDSALEAFSDIADKLIIKANSIYSRLEISTKSKWSAIRTAIVNNFTTAKNKVVSASNEMRTKVATSFSSIKSDTERQWSAFYNKIKRVMYDAESAVDNGIRAIQASIGNGLGEINLSKMRDSLVSGIASVFKTGGEVYAALQKGINDLWEYFYKDKDAVNFSAIGERIVDSLTDGISKSAPWERLKEELKERINNLDIEFSESTDTHSMKRLGSLTEHYTTIAAIDSVMPTIKNIGVPTVVTGTKIPSGVGIKPEKSTPDGLAALEKSVSALVEVVSNLLVSGQTARIEIPVNLDKRQIASAMADYNFSMGRITNGGRR